MPDRELSLLGMALTPGMTAGMMERWMEADFLPAEFFSASPECLRSVLGIDVRHPVVQSNRRTSLERARREMEFIQGHSISVFYGGTNDYPGRLAQLPDAPPVLFAVGTGSLLLRRPVSVVGTRKPTPYGAKMCRDIVTEWCAAIADMEIVSGLAYGIDAAAHQAALDAGHPTIAVVAHGLDRMYPAQHRSLARDIAHNNGLVISEYPSGTPPYRKHFLARNRIIAALADATVVVESSYKGGALSTANVAFNANREVFAVPGRMTDETSVGCNVLIKRNKAHILTSAADLIEEMGWTAGAQRAVQQSLFPSMTEEQQLIHTILSRHPEPLTADAVMEECGMDIPLVMATLTEMEYDGLVVKYPGNRYGSV